MGFKGFFKFFIYTPGDKFKWNLGDVRGYLKIFMFICPTFQFDFF